MDPQCPPTLAPLSLDAQVALLRTCLAAHTKRGEPDEVVIDAIERDCGDLLRYCKMRKTYLEKFSKLNRNGPKFKRRSPAVYALLRRIRTDPKYTVYLDEKRTELNFTAELFLPPFASKNVQWPIKVDALLGTSLKAEKSLVKVVAHRFPQMRFHLHAKRKKLPFTLRAFAAGIAAPQTDEVVIFFRHENAREQQENYPYRLVPIAQFLQTVERYCTEHYLKSEARNSLKEVGEDDLVVLTSLPRTLLELICVYALDPADPSEELYIR